MKKAKAPKPKVTEEILVSEISTLKKDQHNPRKHGKRNLDHIESSLREYGAARSIVIDEGNEILAGNGLFESAMKIGITKVKIVDSTGDEIVAVRRTGLTEKQKREYKIADNRANELSEWDMAVLGDMSEQLDMGKFWNDDELNKLFAKARIDPGFAANVGEVVEQVSGDIPASQVRQIQLFFTVETVARFLEMTTVLKNVYRTENLTDTIEQAVCAAYDSVKP